MLVESVVVAGVLVAAYFLREHVKRSDVREARRLDLEERRLVMEEKRAVDPAPVAPRPMPPVLIQMAQSESEPWAVEDSIKAFREAHRDHDEWGQVMKRAEENAQGNKWEQVN